MLKTFLAALAGLLLGSTLVATAYTISNAVAFPYGLEAPFLRVTPSAAAPFACVAATDGAIYYDTTGHDLCACQNTTWTPIDGSGTCA